MMSVQRLASDVVAACRRRKLTVTTAESCTGGMAAAALTDIAGASDVFEFGYVTYANTAKQKLLGVGEEALAQFGAVSEPVAKAMAEGALRASGADIAVAITGIAGPGGAVPGKPVGTVFIAYARRSVGCYVVREQFQGDRAQIREDSVRRALLMIVQELNANHLSS